jgi:hypothetical protein
MVMTCKAEELGYTKAYKLGNRQMWVDAEGNEFTDEGITLKQHMINFMDDQRNMKLLWKMTEDLSNIDEDYSIKCINCGRIVYCGKCCDNHMSQEMLDKENGIEK